MLIFFGKRGAECFAFGVFSNLKEIQSKKKSRKESKSAAITHFL